MYVMLFFGSAINIYMLVISFSSFQLSHLKTSAETLKESNTEMNNKIESYMQKLKEVKYWWLHCGFHIQKFN